MLEIQILFLSIDKLIKYLDWNSHHFGPITIFFRQSLGGIFGYMVAVHWETLDVMIWMPLFGPSIYRSRLRFRFTLPDKVIMKLLLMERPALIIFLKGRATELSGNIAIKLAKTVIKQAIQKSVGMEIGY
ncbi:hypothetical protein KCTC52924_03023 [Arenibacter antarcticus]|nr:hypothetical protein [Arenibacter sp. H213]